MIYHKKSEFWQKEFLTYRTCSENDLRRITKTVSVKILLEQCCQTGFYVNSYCANDGKVESLDTSQVAHQAGAYRGLLSMKRLGVFLLPLDGMLVHHRVTPSIKFAGTHLYTWVERGTVRVVSCTRWQHNVPGQGSSPDLSIRSRAH